MFHTAPTRLNKNKRLTVVVFAVLLAVSGLLTLPPHVARAANFNMQTGYYVGNGDALEVSGLGFRPDMVIIKSDTTAGVGVWTSDAMPTDTTAHFSAAAVDTSTLISLQPDGFIVAAGATVNNANVRYTWTAFTGSDCTSSGTFCVGTYTGNNTNPRLITTGFQPDLVMVKRSTGVAANFRTSSMANNIGQYFTNTAQNTSGVLFTTIASNGFNVGSTNNANGGIYYYVAFKAVAGIMAVGSYTGDGNDDRNITGFGSGATPSLVMVKNGTSTTSGNRVPVMSTPQQYGDHAVGIGTTAAATADRIQSLSVNMFQVGTAGLVNEAGATIYWVAWGGAAALPTGSGTFKMATGSFTGNATARSISDVGFAPDLVMVKCDVAQFAVFRTSLVAGDSTMVLANQTSIADAITSLDSDGFSLGTNARVNASGATCHWQAFGNAYNPVTRTGAADFMIGAYTGNGIDDRSITAMPWQPDFITIKRHANAANANWRSSQHSGDVTSLFTGTADTAGIVRALEPNGFQIGTNSVSNANGGLYQWFAFRTGANFKLGTYTGTGAAQSITSLGIQPELLWIKRTTNSAGILRPSTMVGNGAQLFTNTANASGVFSGFTPDGFSLMGNNASSNANGGIYRYAAWRVPPAGDGELTVDIVDESGNSVANPSVQLGAIPFGFDCTASSGMLGSASRRLRVTNDTDNPNWSLSITATGGVNAGWTNGTDYYDYNDDEGSPSGCADGPDADSEAGQLSFDPSVATRTPKSGCSNSGTVLGAQEGFRQGSVDAITLMTGSGASTGCYWDVTGIGISQQIPAETAGGTYTLNLTVTIMAT